MVPRQCHVVVCVRSGWAYVGRVSVHRAMCKCGTEVRGEGIVISKRGADTSAVGEQNSGYVPCKAAIVSALVVSNQAAVKIRSSCEREMDSWSSCR